MATLEVGRVCVKTAGREAGKFSVVLKKIDEQFVLITGPKLLTGVKRRRCNINHLEPTPYTMKIKEGATDKEVIKGYENAGLMTKLGLKKPSPEIVKERERGEKKGEKRKGEKEGKKEKKKEKERVIKIKIPTLKKAKKEKKKSEKKQKKSKKVEKKSEKETEKKKKRKS